MFRAVYKKSYVVCLSKYEQYLMSLNYSRISWPVIYIFINELLVTGSFCYFIYIHFALFVQSV